MYFGNYLSKYEDSARIRPSAHALHTHTHTHRRMCPVCHHVTQEIRLFFSGSEPWQMISLLKEFSLKRQGSDWKFGPGCAVIYCLTHSFMRVLSNLQAQMEDYLSQVEEHEFYPRNVLQLLDLGAW